MLGLLHECEKEIGKEKMKQSIEDFLKALEEALK